MSPTTRPPPGPPPATRATPGSTSIQSRPVHRREQQELCLAVSCLCSSHRRVPCRSGNRRSGDVVTLSLVLFSDRLCRPCSVFGRFGSSFYGFGWRYLRREEDECEEMWLSMEKTVWSRSCCPHASSKASVYEGRWPEYDKSYGMSQDKNRMPKEEDEGDICQDSQIPGLFLVRVASWPVLARKVPAVQAKPAEGPRKARPISLGCEKSTKCAATSTQSRAI